MSGVRLRRIFWIGAAGILILAALVAISAILRGDFSDNDARILVSLAAVLYTGGAALSGLALADRGGRARTLGLLVSAAAPVAFALMAWGIWSFVFDGDGDETPGKAAWSSVLLLLAGFMACTTLLMARSTALVRLGVVCGLLATVAATLSAAGIWTEDGGEELVKLLAVLWIMAALTYLLVPVLQRFSAAPIERTGSRVLAELDGVELIATRSHNGLDVRLAPGERLQLRRRA